MIPILYSPTETTFTSEGLGRLSDAISCTVTEERNGPYELEMEYPTTGQFFSDITHSTIIYAVPADGKHPQPFRVYRVESNIEGRATIYAEHISYELNHIPVMPFTASDITSALEGLVNNSVQTNPFSVWTDKSVAGTYTLSEPHEFREMLGGTSGSILDVYGTGEYEFDHYTVKLHLHRGDNNGVVIRYGKDLTELTQDENIESVYTGIVPYWKNEDTVVTLPEGAVWADTVDNFPFKRTAIVDFSETWEDEPTEAQLRAKAESYISSNSVGVPKVSIGLSFVPEWQYSGATLRVTGDGVTAVEGAIERVNLCDTVTVVYTEIGVVASAKVVKTVYNVLEDRYDSIEVGDARSTLASTISEIQTAVEDVNANSTSFIKKIVAHQTDVITGNTGGHIVFIYDSSGLPQELLIMDTDSVDTAVHVIRINSAGIGFSSSGIEGPYNTAWTIDGTFNADFIGAGEILANMLKLYGKMEVLTGQAGARGGYLGYMTGETAGDTENGIAIMSSDNDNFVMCTNNAVWLVNTSGSNIAVVKMLDAEIEISGESLKIIPATTFEDTSTVEVDPSASYPVIRLTDESDNVLAELSGDATNGGTLKLYDASGTGYTLTAAKINSI